MVEILEFDIPKTIGWKIDGKVTEQEIIEIFDLAKATVAAEGEVYIYQEIVSIGGVELDAVMEKLKFLFGGGLNDIRRVAVITDKQWMQTIIGWEDKLFKSIDMRSFSRDEKDQALVFLAE